MSNELKNVDADLAKLFANFRVTPECIYFGASFGCVCISAEGVLLVDEDAQIVRPVTADERELLKKEITLIPWDEIKPKQ